MKQNRCRAFTLFELVLVLGVMVILAALSYPSLEAMYGDYRVVAAADEVRAAWAMGRAQALTEGQAYRFAVVYNQRNFRLAPDTNDFWGGNNSGDDAAPQDPTNAPVIVEDILPKGVRFTSSENQGGSSNSDTPVGNVSPSAWSTVVTFLPDGTASKDVELVFQARGARPLFLRLRGFTSVVTVKQQPLGQGHAR